MACCPSAPTCDRNRALGVGRSRHRGRCPTGPPKRPVPYGKRLAASRGRVRLVCRCPCTWGHCEVKTHRDTGTVIRSLSQERAALWGRPTEGPLSPGQDRAGRSRSPHAARMAHSLKLTSRIFHRVFLTVVAHGYPKRGEARLRMGGPPTVRPQQKLSRLRADAPAGGDLGRRLI